MAVIYTNISALRAAASGTGNSVDMQTAMQRLSTGKRINSASDDAAGMAIAAKMSASITALNQAVRNANDGISMVQTAEGDMAAVGNAMQRMRVLAVQAGNASNGPADRLALSVEYAQMMSEIERVATNSKFNGVPLSGVTNQRFQVGPGATVADGITVDVAAFDATALGIKSTTIDPSPAVAPQALANVTVVAGFHSSGVLATTANLITFRAAGTYLGANPFVVGSYTAIPLTGGGGTGGVATIIVGTDGSIKGTVTTAGTGYATSNATLNFVPTAAMGTTGDTATAITALDTGIVNLSAARAGLGAIQNRLSQTILSLQSNSTNLSAARSRVEDTDYGIETAALARTQILQQAGTAMLAQANQQGQSVLALLKG